MPKRPCAIQVTEDSKTIICGDKFGDVYSLPLHPSTNGTNGASEQSQIAAAGNEKYYEPSATETTVHTKRNLKALQEQMRSKGKLIKSTKEPSDFEHKLLLGHVSMLTDMQLVTSEVNGKHRRYIITCDRDEHIRISRSIPQAHVTENYCLGHAEFVNRIRHIPASNLLVSAGGDDWIGVWDWTTGQLLNRKDLRSIWGSEEAERKPIAVNNLWLVTTRQSQTLLLVACDGINALIDISSTELVSGDSQVSVIDTSEYGQVLDLVDLGEGSSIISTHMKRLQESEFRRAENQWIMTLDASRSSNLDELNRINVPAPNQEGLESLLNGAEKLRKRENDGEED